MIAGHVFLVGMTGSGKSSLGSRVAAELNMPFVEVDQRVGQMFGMPAGQLAQSLGEALYRNAETGVLIALTDESPAIVVTGEGLPLQKENVQLMQNHGTIVHVERPLDQLLAGRKMAGETMDYQEFLQNYKQHIGHYRACADHAVQNTGGLEQGAQGLLSLVLSYS